MAMVRSFKTKGHRPSPVRVKEVEPEVAQVEIDADEEGEKDLVERATEKAEEGKRGRRNAGLTRTQTSSSTSTRTSGRPRRAVLRPRATTSRDVAACSTAE